MGRDIFVGDEEREQALKFIECVMGHKEFNKLLPFFTSIYYLGGHAQLWSTVYDFLSENYPPNTGLATGLTYFIEEEVKK